MVHNSWTIAGVVILCVAGSLDIVALTADWYEVFPDNSLSVHGGHPFSDVLQDQMDKFSANMTSEQVQQFGAIFMKKVAKGVGKKVENSAKETFNKAVDALNGVIGNLIPTTTPEPEDDEDEFHMMRIVIETIKSLAGEHWVMINLLARATNNYAAGCFFAMSLLLLIASLCVLFYFMRRVSSKECATATMTCVICAALQSNFFRGFGITMNGIGLSGIYAAKPGTICAASAILVHMLGTVVVSCGLREQRARIPGGKCYAERSSRRSEKTGVKNVRTGARHQGGEVSAPNEGRAGSWTETAYDDEPSPPEVAPYPFEGERTRKSLYRDWMAFQPDSIGNTQSTRTKFRR